MSARALLVAAITLAVACAGCCKIISSLDELSDDEVAPAERVNLGDAVFAAETPPADPRRFEWTVDTFKPRGYRAGYALGATKAKSLHAAHRAMAKRLGYREGGKGTITMQPARDCATNLACVYRELVRTNGAAVTPLAGLFSKRALDELLTLPQAAELVVTMVQSIKYEVPEQEPFGVLPPALVAAEGTGDCDSKAVLAIMLLHELGIDAVLLSSRKLAHAAVGIALPGSNGMSIKLRGTTYRYTEVTAEGWAIGATPPEENKPQLWEAIDIYEKS